jgi:hypothetical protein
MDATSDSYIRWLTYRNTETVYRCISSAHILCECEALSLLRHAYLGPFFLEPKEPSGASVKLQGSLVWTWGTKSWL